MTGSKAKPKAKKTSRASNPKKSASRSKFSLKTGAKAKPGVEANRANESAASRRIDERIRTLGDWRAETLAEVRRLIHEADPEIVEECKWIKPSNPSGVPVWSRAGIVCTGETYKQVVKLTFARGASLADPRRLFNSSLEGGTRRAIDIREGEVINVKAFKALILAAVAENLRSSAPKSQLTKSQPAKLQPPKSRSSPQPSAKARPIAKAAKSIKAPKGKKGDAVLLAGGNPQIARADGDAPVQAYIAAMPGWKRDLGRRLDAIITQAVPQVRKAVKWNSPFYGIDGQGWFVSFHVFTRYVKVSFFRGASLQPIPPGGTPKSKEARWIDIYEDDRLDEAQMAKWVRQAAALPGWLS